MTALPDLSVQLYSVREPLADDFSGTLGRLAEIGLTQVEPFQLLANAENLASGLRKHGLTAPTTHQSLDGGDLEAIFQAAAELGVGTVIHPFTAAEFWQTRQDVQRIADMLGAAAGVAARHGVRVAYHNHAWELSTIIDGRTALEVLADALDPAVVLQLDTYWAASAGRTSRHCWAGWATKVVALHLKDGPLNGITAEQLPLGQGELPAPEIVAAATALEFPVLEFDQYAGDIFEGIAASYAYATATLGASR